MVKLSEKERAILLCGQLQARASTRSIAKQTGYREHTVRYAFEKLDREGVVHRYPFINIFPLGYEEYGLFLSFVGSPKERARFLGAITKNRQVSWLLELGGDYNFGLAICARRAAEVTAFLQNLSEMFGTAIVGKSVSVRTSWTLYPRQYLSPRKFRAKPLSCGDTGEAGELDEVDRRMLTGLAKYPAASLRDIAMAMKVPLTTAQNRVKKLSTQKIIVGHAYEVNPQQIGAQGFRLLIYTKAMHGKFRAEFRAHCEADPNIFAVIECVGSWDFELKVEVERAEELHQLTGKLYESFPRDLREIKVLTVFDTPKLSFYPFE